MEETERGGYLQSDEELSVDLTNALPPKQNLVKLPPVKSRELLKINEKPQNNDPISSNVPSTSKYTNPASSLSPSDPLNSRETAKGLSGSSKFAKTRNASDPFHWPKSVSKWQDNLGLNETHDTTCSKLPDSEYHT